MKTQLFSIAILLICTVVKAQNSYHLGPNSQRYEKIPRGTITQHTWEGDIYPNTSRDYFVYVPAQYDGSQAAALMVFQDGHAYVKEDGDFRASIVFDNLIHQGKMPITIGLFINPGHDVDKATPESPWRASNRSIEYDEVSDTYARFLTEELIPELSQSYHISSDPKMRAIAGLSSGGICAFSAAWFKPDHFHKVLSHIGSFTDIRGGHNYPPIIRENDKKNIKIFLQDGKNDLDNQFGNWWLANLQMEAALKYKGYEYRFAAGDGGHDGKHEGAIFPKSLIWLWSDVVPKRVAAGVYDVTASFPDTVLISGETMSLANMTFQQANMREEQGVRNLYDEYQEQIVIVKEGEVEVTMRDETQVLGPRSVAFLLPGEKGTIRSRTLQSSYYRMVYTSLAETDLKRGREDGGSFTIDFDKVVFKKHNKGGVRSFFNRSTAMCPYYEMHITNLNPGIKSHEPHVHSATEIILMIDGETQMEIGNEIHKGNKGDVYLIPSNVPHAIKNIGDKQCQYFAFQWE